MEDQEIIELYFRRDEQAIAQTDQKYGPFCYSVAYNVLSDREDAREKAQEIIASYPEKTIKWKPFTQYPLH